MQRTVQSVPSGSHLFYSQTLCIFLDLGRFNVPIGCLESASDLIHVKTMKMPPNDGYCGNWKVDEQFIQSSHPKHLLQQYIKTTCHFISTGIVHNSGLETSLSVIKRFEYDQGFMFFIHHRLIRILNVASGTHLNDIHVDPSRSVERIKVNSKFIVMSTSSINEKKSLCV